MKSCSIAMCVLLVLFAGSVHSQTSVTTLGLMAGQCVQSDGVSSITNLGCSGRKNVIIIGALRLLTVADCGSVIQTNDVAQWEVIMPPVPPANCEFAFEAGTFGFYIDFNGQTAKLPGFENVTQWTIPVQSAFRTKYPSISLQFNGTDWEQSGFSSMTNQATVQPNLAPQLMHGQVHFGWDSDHSKFQLCPDNGPGGLIVDGKMWQIPIDCLTLAQSATFSSSKNYFYAVHNNDDHAIPVSNVTDNGSGKIRISVSDARGNLGDTILVGCINISGAIQANVMDAAIVSSTAGTPAWDLLHTSSSGLGAYMGGGSCEVLRLQASQTDHITGQNGVEILNTSPLADTHYTLTGMCYIGPSNAVNDTTTQRDCAGWFNRGMKTCTNRFSGSVNTSSLVYTEVSTAIRGEFVTWGTSDPLAQSDLSWSISGTMKNATNGDGAAVTAGFDGSTQETEETAYINPPFTVSGGSSASVSGSKSGLSENVHFMTLLGKAVNGGAANYFGSSTLGMTPGTSIEVRIPQ